MEAFTLVGVNGNAFSVMGYTGNALRTAGLEDKSHEMTEKATSGDYNNLIRVCMEYIDMANNKLREDGYELEEEE